MKWTRKVKRSITLIEIMIVMFLITVIGGAVAFNVRGSMEKGKAFSTFEGIEKIKGSLLLAIAENPDVATDLQENWRTVLANSPLIRNAEKMQKDGWGEGFDVTVTDGDEGIVITVNSGRFSAYKAKNVGAFSDNESSES